MVSAVRNEFMRAPEFNEISRFRILFWLGHPAAGHEPVLIVLE